jgi:hypothetical protein
MSQRSAYPFIKGFSGLMLLATYRPMRLARCASVVYTPIAQTLTTILLSD